MAASRLTKCLKRREQFQAMLSRLDADKDGALSKAEFAKARPGAQGARPQAGPPGSGDAARTPPGLLLKSLDSDGDGKLSKDEIANASDFACRTRQRR